MELTTAVRYTCEIFKKQYFRISRPASGVYRLTLLPSRQHPNERYLPFVAHHLSVVCVYLDFSVVLRLPTEVLLADRVRVKPVSICRFVFGSVAHEVYLKIEGSSEPLDIRPTVSSRFWCSKRQHSLNSTNTFVL